MGSSTRTGTISGTILVLLFKIDLSELLTSALLAAVGAIVSFGISVLLKRIFRRKDRR